MTKRNHALAVIRYEYAIHGHETQEAVRAFVENRISYEARCKVVREGLKIYEQKGDVHDKL